MSNHTELVHNTRPGSATSSRVFSASQTSLNDDYIHRIPINKSAVLGSLYDARTDCITGRLPLEKNLIAKTPVYNSVRCEVMEGATFDKEKLFQMVGLDGELWLNLILNIAPAEGIASLINYMFSKSENTRFLYYYYSSEEKSISNQNNMVRTYIPKEMPDITATHVISGIKLGIQALIVLQLSSDDGTNLDRLLGKIKEQLVKNKVELTKDEKYSLDRIVVARVFSNIPELIERTTLTDICQKITTMKPHAYSHLPLKYTLRTIKWFYPSYSAETAKYIPVKPEIFEVIKQYWIQLSFNIEELKIPFDQEVEKLLKEHLQQQMHEVQQQINEVQEMYSVEVQRTRDLVLKIRNGTLEQETIAEILIDKSEKSFHNVVDNITKRRRALIDKVKLINDFKSQNIKYFNVGELPNHSEDDLTTVLRKIFEKGNWKIIFCCDDELKIKKSEQWNDFRNKLINECEPNSSSDLVYADFSYSSFHLPQMKVSSFKSPDDINEQFAPPKLNTSSTTETASPSKNQSKNTEKSSNPSRSPKAHTTDATTPRQEKTIRADEQQSNPSSSSILPALEDLSPKKVQSKPTKEPLKLSRSPGISNTEDTTLRKEMSSLNNERTNSPKSATISTSDVFLERKDQFEDTKGSVRALRSPKASVPENAIRQEEPHGFVKEPSNLSKSSITATPTPSPRNTKQPAVKEKPSDSPSSAELTKTDRTALSKVQTNHVEDQCNASSLRTVSATPPAPRAKNQRINTEESLHPSTSSKTSTGEFTSPSKNPLNNAKEKINSSKASTILEPTQRTEEQSEDIDKHVNESESSKPSIKKRTSLSLKQHNHEEKRTNPQSPLTSLHSEDLPPPKKLRPDSSRPSTVNYTNVLLLGESGVGKSTFINALVNYLAFDTLGEACEKPLVLMPVSFMMTVGDNFEERTLRFGGVDSNEDHDHPGRSVTQHCRSYVFQIGTQTKVRIIDTPGMGDTRGLDQDDLNMQHILSFINNLPHLNAICILLKPNESRLNIVLRSYFTRLLNFLGENARNNIIFCFTNTRATFFAPGNTGPLLREMIGNLSIKGIPFKKTNTFCFDSESFRYLIALQNGINFDEYQEKEYQRSWGTSVKESNRLLEYICGQLESYSQNEWQSIEHAQSKISQMVRPVLEAMRNTFRNITLLKEKSPEKLIKLCPTGLSQPSTICYGCERAPTQLNNFWILLDDLHIVADKCEECRCSRQKHVRIDYRLEYESFDVVDKQSLFIEMKSNLDKLIEALLEFADFYAYVSCTSKQSDPILPTLKRMVAEENQVCSPRNTQCYNSVLHDFLNGMRKDYKERYDKSITYRKPINLSNIYETIKSVSDIDMVNEQIDIINKAHTKYMKQHEKKVS